MILFKVKLFSNVKHLGFHTEPLLYIYIYIYIYEKSDDVSMYKYEKI